MNDFIIMTDSSCDLPQSIASEMNICAAPLSVVIEKEGTFKNYLDEREITFRKFYDLLRDGKMPTTSAVNVGEFIELMRPHLEAGKDILNLSFSSALSTTYNSACAAAQMLSEEFPQRKIYTVDTRSASLGQGLLVYLCAKKAKEENLSLEQARDYAQDLVEHLCHWFTVDDLNHLKRGGRVSASAAAVGTLLNIKPVMHMDDEGRLIPMQKVKGRKASIKALFEHMRDTAISPEEQTIFISHSDSYDDAVYLADMIKENLHVKDVIINYVGPVIGAHTGCGTIALFFVGEHR